jgi:predicted dehydrogenase
VTPSNKKVRVGVLGAGAWAEFAHLPATSVIRAASWSRSPTLSSTRRTSSREKFDIPQVYATHEELIAREDIDLVDVCTPSATHFALSWAALEAGKHVLCEKPVAYDYQDTLRAAALAKQKGVKTKLGFTFRYSPAMQYMKR